MDFTQAKLHWSKKPKGFKQSILSMSYKDYVKYLQKKYGIPNGSYFINDSFKSKNNKIVRGDEGLVIHHVFENKAENLSNPASAIQHPWEFQLPKNLVYANIMEHALLHIKICIETNMSFGYKGLFIFIIPEINKMMSGAYYEKSSFIAQQYEINNEFISWIYILTFQRLLGRNNFLLPPKTNIATPRWWPCFNKIYSNVFSIFSEEISEKQFNKYMNRISKHYGEEIVNVLRPSVILAFASFIELYSKEKK